MRIAVFGATSMVGSAIVAEATGRGHHVIAVSGRARPGLASSHITPIALDIADTEALGSVFTEADAAVLTIRLAPGEEDGLAPLTLGFLDASERHGKRVLVIGGSAPLRSPTSPETLLIDDPDHVPEAWKAIASASLEQFRVCQDHPYNSWVYLSPPAMLEPGERSGHYRRGTTTLLTNDNGISRITAPDLAIAVVDELEHPGADRHFTVAHGGQA